MLVRTYRTKALMSIVALCTTLLCVPFLSSTSWADATGTLMLKVWGCKTSNWISNAAVSVTVIRPGEGQIDSDSGYTDGSGYVEFTLDGLEAGDEAHVTVTPSGSGPDSDHVYYWVEPEGRVVGYWDTGVLGDSLCVDDWYDQEAGIIKCAYELPDSHE